MKKEDRRKIEEEWLKWQRSLNKELEQTRYRVVYLPPKDLMPYEDLSQVTKIQDATERLLDEWGEGGDNVAPVGNLVVNEEWTRTISMALTIYKATLMTVHGERIREEIREASKSGKQEVAGEPRESYGDMP